MSSGNEETKRGSDGLFKFEKQAIDLLLWNQRTVKLWLL